MTLAAARRRIRLENDSELNTVKSGIVAKVNKQSKKRVSIETSSSLKSHPTREELYAFGKSLRDKCPRHSHGV